MENKTPKYMRAKQLSIYLSIALPTIYLYLRQGKITSIKVSNRITLFNVSEVEKALFKKFENKY
jgi:predicted site-specific integrase-resolvase